MNLWKNVIFGVRVNGAQGAHTKDENGRTVLIEATQAGNYNLVMVLVDKGLDVNAKNKAGDTALSLGSAKDHSEIVQCLKAHGAK